MLENKGVRGTELNWFRSYLTGRQQFVSIDSKKSTFAQIKLGVPQGSVLGPLLFIIYIDGLPDVADVPVYLFADDTVILAADDNLQCLETALNREFKKICQFFRTFKLSLNPSKTQYIIFSGSEAAHSEDIHLFIDNNNENEDLIFHKHEITRIKPTDDNPTYKYLGILMDPHFSFRQHVAKISTKLSKALYVLRKVKNFLPVKALLLLYYSLFHCHLIYAAEIWSSAPEHLINQLFLKQKAAIRLIANAKYNAHTQPLFKQFEILPLTKLILYQKLVFFQSVIQKRAPPTFDNVWFTNREYRINRVDANNYRELRDDGEYYIPFSRTQTLKRAAIFVLPHEWNLLPPNLQIIRNVKEFKVKLKEYFMDQIPVNFICTRIFCPACNSLS